MRRNGSVRLVFVCLLLAAGIFGQTTEKLNSARIFGYAERISESAKNQIWNEFDARNYMRAKNDSGGGYIFFSTAPDSQDNQVFFWKVVDDYFQNHTLEENLSITFHEAFHAFQRDPKRAGAKWGAENSLLVFEYQESSARNNALFSIESRILRLALESKNKREFIKKVREFLAVRKLRQSELEPRFVEFEKGAELNEGLAEYAGTKAIVIGMEAAKQRQISVSFTEPNTDAFLKKKYEKLGSITKIGRNIRLKFYYVGSAQSFLLDRLMPDWKTKVQMEGKALQDLLETIVGKLPTEKEVETILRQNGYENILSEEEKLVAQRKAENQSLLEKTLNQKGRKYTIDYSALSQPGGIRSFDPMNVTVVTPKIRIHTRQARFGSGDSFTAEFSQPVVEDLDKKRYTTVISENENESITVDGVAVDLTQSLEKRFSQSLKLNSANFKLEAKSGLIKISGREVIIKLTDN